MGQFPSLQEIIIYGLAFALAITVHEFAHARAAYAAGDDTPRLQGRLSINPLDHLDPVGTVMFVLTMLSGFGLAWGKPVQVNAYNFKNPRRDNIRVSLWGPASNVITAFVLAMIVRAAFALPHILPSMGQHVMFVLNDPILDLIHTCIIFNLAIAFFNLIPVAPLDGSHILSGLLPVDKARRYDLFMARYGMAVLILLLVTRITSIVISVPASLTYALFMWRI